MSNTRIESVFKEAVNTQNNQKPDFFTRAISNSYGWGVATFVCIFVILFITNPPFVQKKKQKNDMIKQGPNLTIIFILSLVGGSIVVLSDMFFK